MGLFTKKSFAELQAEADRGLLRRSLGPWHLTALGIGSIIGTGIFVLTGTAASQNAGPALVFSMFISAAGCAFAGLCYAEFAAMVPVAGSAYTYRDLRPALCGRQPGTATSAGNLNNPCTLCQGRIV